MFHPSVELRHFVTGAYRRKSQFRFQEEEGGPTEKVHMHVGRYQARDRDDRC